MTDQKKPRGRKPAEPKAPPTPEGRRLEIVYRDPATLTPDPRNARTHSPEQIEQLRASIREFGFTNPVLLRPNGMIGAGHGRVEAAKAEGLASVPTCVVEGLTDDQWRAYVIADNRLALNAGWDEDLLRTELAALTELEIDLSSLGFNDGELTDILSEGRKGKTDPDQVPETPETPTSQSGDTWLLGDHRLRCGDSTAAADVDQLMQGQKADLLFTDPPWNVNYGAIKSGNAQGYKPRTILNDHMDDDGWLKFVRGFCASFYAATKPGAPAYVVMSAQEWPTIDKVLREAKFHWSSTIIWVKDALVLSRKDYHTQYEPIWYGWNEDAARIRPVKDRKQSDVWNVDRPRVSELHPTTKPVELIERAVLNSSGKRAMVLDLFGGSGSTMIACEQTGRQCRMMELDPKYADVIVMRWEEFTGRTATLEATGQTFRQVAEERGKQEAA